MPTYVEPPIREPMVDRDGRLTRPWLAYFQSQYKKLGGPSNTAPIVAENAINSQTALTAATAQDSVSAAYVYTPSNPLDAEDIGGSVGARIIIDTVTIDWVDVKGKVYNGATLTLDDNGAALAYATQYFVYFDDPNRAGGTPVWKATADHTKLNQLSRWHVGAVITPTDAGAPTIGGGDGGSGGFGRIRTYGTA